MASKLFSDAERCYCVAWRSVSAFSRLVYRPLLGQCKVAEEWMKWLWNQLGIIKHAFEASASETALLYSTGFYIR